MRYLFTNVPLSALIWERDLGVSAPSCILLQPLAGALGGRSRTVLLTGSFSLGLLIQGNLLA